MNVRQLRPGMRIGSTVRSQRGFGYHPNASSELRAT
jgi:hypothetical protein